MAFCKNCGQEMTENATHCANCGTAVAQENTPAPANDDKGGFLWGALGCCIPIVGLILFLIWRTDKPKTAKSAGIGAIVGVVATILIYIVYFVLIIGLGVAGELYL